MQRTNDRGRSGRSSKFSCATPWNGNSIFRNMSKLRQDGKRTREYSFRSLFVASHSGYSPRVGFFVSVVKRLESLLLFVLGKLGGIAEFEKGGSEFNEPFRVDGRHFAHVFLGRHDQLVIDHPLRLPAEFLSNWRRGGGEKEKR